MSMKEEQPIVKIPVSDYLSKHNVQKLIEEAVNECYNRQSSNPTAFFAHFFSQKTNSGAIYKIIGREILDSRGNPTVEADVYCGDESKISGRASAPSGASTGSNEAMELRDGDKSRYMGKGTLKAVQNINSVISEGLKGKPVDNLKEIDDLLCQLDGTDLKTKLGGNALTAVSFAVATAGAQIGQEELFLYLARQFHQHIRKSSTENLKYRIPLPLVNILNGGKHAGGNLKIQEFMIVPLRHELPFKENLRLVTEVYHTLGKILTKAKGVSAKNVGDEGGFAPSLEDPEEALKYIEQAIKEAGFEIGKDIGLALDCASSEFYDKETQKYEVIKGEFLTSDEMVDYYEKMVNNHPGLISIEDGLDEKDYEGWAKLTQRLGSRIMLVGDDLYTTNPKYIREGIEKKWATALLLKVNQIGTISESMDAANLIFNANQNVIVSHRSGETGTNIISDLAVAIGAKYIKTGAPARGERVGKYNRLLQIEEYLKQHNLLDSNL